jgi:anti-sigma factor RsiW
MDCAKIRKLIMTDYTDSEIDPAIKSQVDSHINSCSTCRELLESVKQASVEPFKDTEVLKAPEAAWESIKTQIERQKQPPLNENITEKLYTFIHTPRYVLSLTAAAAVLLIVLSAAGNIFYKRSTTNHYLAEHLQVMSYLEYGDNGEELATAFSDTGFGTDIEEYFL